MYRTVIETSPTAPSGRGGYNPWGSVGDGTTTNRTSPTLVSTLSSITKIGAGYFHSIAVSSTGVVYTWGRNNYSQLGDGTAIDRLTPVAISDAGYEWKVSTPTISLAAGVYATNQTVTLPASNTASAAYEMKVGAIVFSPGATTYTSAQSITMTSATPGITIRYTTDGTTPTTSCAAYSAPVNIATTTTLKAMGVKADWSDSVVTTGPYTMNFGTLATPSSDQATGTYINSVTVTLSAATGAAIQHLGCGSSRLRLAAVAVRSERGQRRRVRPRFSSPGVTCGPPEPRRVRRHRRAS